MLFVDSPDTLTSLKIISEVRNASLLPLSHTYCSWFSNLHAALGVLCCTMAMEMPEEFVEWNSVLNTLVSLLIITPEIQLRLEEEEEHKGGRAHWLRVNEVQVNRSKAPKASRYILQG